MAHTGPLSARLPHPLGEIALFVARYIRIDCRGAQGGMAEPALYQGRRNESLQSRDSEAMAQTLGYCSRGRHASRSHQPLDHASAGLPATWPEPQAGHAQISLALPQPEMPIERGDQLRRQNNLAYDAGAPPLQSDDRRHAPVEVEAGGREAEDFRDAGARPGEGLFGAARGEDGAAVYRDRAGGAVVISESLFKDASGAWKVFKGGRAEQYLQAAEALKDPDEIWVDWERNAKTGEVSMRRSLPAPRRQEPAARRV